MGGKDRGGERREEEGKKGEKRGWRRGREGERLMLSLRLRPG